MYSKTFDLFEHLMKMNENGIYEAMGVKKEFMGFDANPIHDAFRYETRSHDPGIWNEDFVFVYIGNSQYPETCSIKGLHEFQHPAMSRRAFHVDWKYDFNNGLNPEMEVKV